jgi:hypothetical protein
MIISSGARSALLMVVAPEAIVEYFLGIDSKSDLFFLDYSVFVHISFLSTSLVIVDT